MLIILALFYLLGFVVAFLRQASRLTINSHLGPFEALLTILIKAFLWPVHLLVHLRSLFP